MIRMIIDMCTIENVPKEDSETYKRILEMHGPEIADKCTYELTIPPYEEMEGEMKVVADTILNGYKPGGMPIENKEAAG